MFHHLWKHIDIRFVQLYSRFNAMGITRGVVLFRLAGHWSSSTSFFEAFSFIGIYRAASKKQRIIKA